MDQIRATELFVEERLEILDVRCLKIFIVYENCFIFCNYYYFSQIPVVISDIGRMSPEEEPHHYITFIDDFPQDEEIL